MLKTELTEQEVMARAAAVAAVFDKTHKKAFRKRATLYGVPKGGVVPCELIARELRSRHWETFVVNSAETANVIVDDLVDSGKTRRKFMEKHPGAVFLPLYNKLANECDSELGWIVFPWERENDRDTSADDIPVRLLQYIGEDPEREGLTDTPKRFLNAWREWTSGYGQDPKAVVRAFTDGAENVDEMVVVSDIPFYSHCEHHLAPFFGCAHIAYIPQGRILGLSKFKRLTDIFARRLQVQERLTNQIADVIDEVLQPRGVGVMVEARHLCMESRGINSPGQTTTTSALRKAMRSQADTRDEFLRLCGK